MNSPLSDDTADLTERDLATIVDVARSLRIQGRVVALTRSSIEVEVDPALGIDSSYRGRALVELDLVGLEPTLLFPATARTRESGGRLRVTMEFADDEGAKLHFSREALGACLAARQERLRRAG